MDSPTAHQGSSTLQASQLHDNYATVSYDDEYEKVNATLQVAWSNVMGECDYYNMPSFYQKVKCLLISWDKACDDIHTGDEVSELASLLEKSFNYKVIRKLLNSNSDHHPQLQLMKYIADFLMEEDGDRTLLLVYYAGHGSPRSAGNGCHGLTLSGHRKLSQSPEEVNEIVWKQIEDNLLHTKSDVLEIFDCCYAGDLGRDGQTWSRRSFEFLGACPSGNTTRSPGPESFTKALIWALRTLADQQTRFLVSELSNKIRNAPNFPKDQVPVQIERGLGSIERIMLAPLEDATIKSKSKPPPSDVTIPQGLLHLNFIFNEKPTKEIITNFGKALNKFMYTERMPVNKVVWGGLTSWDGIQPSPGAHVHRVEAVRLFRKAVQRSSGRKNRNSAQLLPAGLQTPVSSVGRVSRTPSHSPDDPKRLVKRRKTTDTTDEEVAVDSEESRANKAWNYNSNASLEAVARELGVLVFKASTCMVVSVHPVKPSHLPEGFVAQYLPAAGSDEQEIPPTRANVAEERDPTQRAQTPRKWNAEHKVWMRKSASEPFDYIMFVKSWQYDEARQGWDYKLKDENGIEYEAWVKETDTKKA